MATLTLGKLGWLTFSWLPPIRTPRIPNEEAMKTTLTPTAFLSHPAHSSQSLSQPIPTQPATAQLLPPQPNHERTFIRHILLGHPEAIQQTIHLLHTLHYTETVLWSPAIALQAPLILTPTPGEAISLLRKQV